MSEQITELVFLEKLASRFNIPVPQYLAADASSAEIRKALIKWGGKAMVKLDMLTGRRGKAGAVKQVCNHIEAQKQLKSLHGLEVNGHFPRTSYLVEYIESDLEIYVAITYDSRFLGPSMTVSLAGGIDIEEIDETQKVTFAIDVYKGVGAYQVSKNLEKLACPKKILGALSQVLVSLWDMFISSGMRMCEVNPWRINKQGKPIACDFKAVFDEANFKFQNLGFDIPEYPADITVLEEEMRVWDASSHQGQAHVADLGGNLVLPILFGGGASTIITETLMQNGGDPIFLSDFGGNPPYERMFGTVKRCFTHHLGEAGLLLILGGKANNTMIDITFSAIADALVDYVEENGPIDIPVVVGRGGPQLVKGLLTMKDTLESLGQPYVIFGPDTPVTLVAEYAARLARAYSEKKESEDAS